MMKRGAKNAAGENAKREAAEIPARFAPVAAAFSGARGVTRERGWRSAGAVLKWKGKIFAMLVRGEFVAKLPKARVDVLVSAGAGKRFDPRRDGRLMKEWIVVPAG